MLLLMNYMYKQLLTKIGKQFSYNNIKSIILSIDKQDDRNIIIYLSGNIHILFLKTELFKTDKKYLYVLFKNDSLLLSSSCFKVTMINYNKKSIDKFIENYIN